MTPAAKAKTPRAKNAPAFGFLGGSFDPVHKGHLALARAAIAQLKLKRLYFVPTGRSPLKDAAGAGAAHRLAMLKLAIADMPKCGIIPWEIKTREPSYTVDTARRLRARWPKARLYWIIGQDKLAELPRWRRIETLAKLLEFAWARREGFAARTRKFPSYIRLTPIEGVAAPESSSAVRERLQAGKPAAFLLPRAVNRYIKEHRLYALSDDD